MKESRPRARRAAQARRRSRSAWLTQSHSQSRQALLQAVLVLLHDLALLPDVQLGDAEHPREHRCPPLTLDHQVDQLLVDRVRDGFSYPAGDLLDLGHGRMLIGASLLLLWVPSVEEKFDIGHRELPLRL